MEVLAKCWWLGAEGGAAERVLGEVHRAFSDGPFPSPASEPLNAFLHVLHLLCLLGLFFH